MLCLIEEIAKIPGDSITARARVDDELKMESVAFVELCVTIEDEFQIEVDPLLVLELNEFGAIVDYVHQCATD